ncbi:hypothetical protein [Azospirillum isscasi]|uniref:DUF4145 domain-containing protein n=1 Tax=Azospirillum isscasi TaxID=3053926 RepID=A0ABU0WJT4_9PROT|nr:hypothetical protein [Azospirillum isscasi]MDQ2104426.1 hypothetical protein [Azospirillum isscasi]
MTLHIDRWTLLAQHRQIAEAVLGTMLPTFGDIERKAQAFSTELESKDCSSDDPCHNEDEYRAEQIIFFEDGLRSVEAEMAGMAVVALYHLWERSVKALISRKCLPYRLGEVAKANFDKIKALLDHSNLPEPCRGTLDAINLGRLIANVIKHGEGNAADDLRKLEQKLFQRSWNDEWFDLPSNRDVTLIWPQPEHARTLADAISTFWQTLPDNYFPTLQAPSLHLLTNEQS